MKALLPSLLLIAAAASPEARAGIDLNDYVLVNAAFGMSEMTGVPAPIPESAEQARVLFEELQGPMVGPVRLIGVDVDGVKGALGAQLTRSVARFALVMKRSELTQASCAASVLTFRGTVAEALFQALPAPAAGGPARSVANLSCLKPRAGAVCSLAQAAYRSISLQALLDDLEGRLDEAAMLRLIQAAGYHPN